MRPDAWVRREDSWSVPAAAGVSYRWVHGASDIAQWHPRQRENHSGPAALWPSVIGVGVGYRRCPRDTGRMAGPAGACRIGGKSNRVGHGSCSFVGSSELGAGDCGLTANTWWNAARSAATQGPRSVSIQSSLNNGCGWNRRRRLSQHRSSAFPDWTRKPTSTVVLHHSQRHHMGLVSHPA